ncbi:MAG: pyrimidine 5'-nucleotidase [Alphaproteobacteria bacterium]|nr:pyrimidine 5'-nucleotidase [Alphaproteobacteria bacterium]
MKPFNAIDTWIFDLDNTLYAPQHNLFTQIDKRMTAFIAAYLNLDKQEARRLQKDYLHAHGLTLFGLMKHHNMAPDAFLEFVHDIDVSALPPDAALAAAIKNLAGRKFIFTNSTRAHAVNVMTRLGIVDLFEGIFDIVDAAFTPKPQALPYEAMLKKFAVCPAQAAFFEDRAENLRPAKACGMATILVSANKNSDTNNDAALAKTDYIDYHTDDLSGFLVEIDFLCRADSLNMK